MMAALDERPAWRLRPSSPPWYIIKCKHQQWKLTRQWLRNIEDQIGWETYYPLISELRPLPRKRLSYAQRMSGVQIMRPAVRPFLPSLVFARPGASTIDIADYPNVFGYVIFADERARISNELICNLRRREQAGGSTAAIPGATPAEFIFEIGEHVRMANGPFAGFNASIVQLPDCPIEKIQPETRLQLCIDIFGRPTNVETTVDAVEKT